MRRAWCMVLILVAALAIAACGGGSSRSSNESANAPTLKGGDPQNSSAGQASGYQPTGQLIADNGFRPDKDGFSFENYGNEGNPQNMSPADVQELFGDQVCASGTGSSCQLIPPAQVWMDNQNTAMAGGHCEGFSVAALRFYDGNVKLDSFGSVDATGQLKLDGNSGLQGEIAKDYSFQNLPLEQQALINGTPTEILDKLISALKDKSDYYTIGIYKRDGSGGHAVTPYAVEDRGGGKMNILIYDNNFPGVTRAIAVDRNADTWSYTGGTNPSDTNQEYGGDASTKTLNIEPLSAGLQQQPCPFCNGQGANAGDTSKGSVLEGSEQYNEISLQGDPSNHAHVVLADDQGHHTGVINGKQVNDIPGAKIDNNLANQDWAASPEPTYHVPVSANVTVTIDGTDLNKPDTEELNLVGPGIDTLVQDIKLDPGQKDEVSFNSDGLGYVFKTAPNQAESPILAAGVQGKSADYGFAVKAVNLKGGSNVALKLDQTNEQLDIDTAGTPGAGDYVVSVYREDEQGKTQWTSKDEAVHLEAGEVAHLDYGATQPGSPMKLDIKKADGSTQTMDIPEENS